jgi:hypothetical protein
MRCRRVRVVVLEDAIGAVDLGPEDGRAIDEMRGAGARLTTLIEFEI